MEGSPTVYLGVRVPPDLLTAARTTAGRPDAGTTELIRYALAKLAGLDDDTAEQHAHPRVHTPYRYYRTGKAAA